MSQVRRAAAGARTPDITILSVSNSLLIIVTQALANVTSRITRVAQSRSLARCTLCHLPNDLLPNTLFPGHVYGCLDRVMLLLVMKVPLAVCCWFFPSAGLLCVTVLRSVSAIISVIILLHCESSAIIAPADHHPTL